MPRSRLVIFSAVGLLLLAFLLFAFWPRAALVDLAPAVRGPMAVTIKEEARAEVRDPYTLSAPVLGRLARIELEPGDRVEAGDTLALILPADPSVLDPRTAQQAEAAVAAAKAALASARARVSRAEADLDYHRADMARMEALRRADAVAQRDYESEIRAVRSAEAALEAARADVATQEAELERARALLMTPHETPKPMAGNSRPAGAMAVKAPVSGLVLQVMEESEGLVQAGTPLLQLGDPRTDLRIVAELLSSDAVEVEKGDPVLVEAWGGPPLSAVVERVEPWGFTKYSALGVEEQRVRVTMGLRGEAQGHDRLGHGYRAEVRIVVWQEDDVLHIPSSALFRQEGEWAVFKAEGGRAVLTALRIGEDNGDKAQILEGLSPGDLVVTYPSVEISQGRKIKPRPAAD